MSELFELMAGVLGDAISVWLLFSVLMVLAVAMAQLAGNFKNMHPVTLVVCMALLGAFAIVTGARFSETGQSLIISLVLGALMLASFIASACFAPRKAVAEQQAGTIGPWNPVSGRFESARGYDERGRPRS